MVWILQVSCHDGYLPAYLHLRTLNDTRCRTLLFLFRFTVFLLPFFYFILHSFFRNIHAHRYTVNLYDLYVHTTFLGRVSTPASRARSIGSRGPFISANGAVTCTSNSFRRNLLTSTCNLQSFPTRAQRFESLKAPL